MSRVFVSYSHDSPEHRDRVLGLAHRLLAAGYDVRLDRFEGHPSGESWPQWMCRQVREADRIVCVCTAAYRKRFEGDERDRGLGVSWEGHLLTTELYLNRGRTSRIVPLYAAGEEDVPFVLRAHAPRPLDPAEDVIAALGGVVGPARAAPVAGEGMREIVSVGALLAPLFEPPRKYPGVAGYLPSLLLRAEHAIVPFLGGADRVRDLLDWADGGGARVRLVHGPGGAGKTRLALEVAGRLVGQGWRAGSLAWRQLSDEALDALFADPIPLLLILDYAETRPVELVQVLRRLVEHREANVRVLVLARGIGDWWTRANGEVRALEGLTAGALPVRVEAVEDGAAHARKAAESFAEWEGVAPPKSIPDRGLTALDRQVEALVAVKGGRGTGMDGLLTHEDGYIARAAKAEGIAAARARLLPAAMALMTLAGGVGPEEPEGWLRAAPHLGKLGDDDAAQIVALLATLYPRAGGGIDGVRPDRIGEALVAREDGASGSLALTAVDRGRVKAALTVLTRLGAATDREPLRRLIEARRELVALDAVAVGQETGDPIGVVLAESLEGRPDAGLAGRLADVVPTSTVALRELGIVAGRQAVAAAGDEARRAARLNNLAIHLNCAGRREEALAAIEEGVRLLRRLAEPDGDVSLPSLAISLNTLALCLADLGRVEAAFAAVEEAVAAHRRLAAGRPIAFTPALVNVLNGLARCLAELGRWPAAATAIEEAVAISRELAVAGTDRFLGSLAMSLSHQATILTPLGRADEALAAAEESARIYRTLAEARPDAFLPDLGIAVDNLAGRLAGLGRTEEALAAIEEAVTLRRPLAAVRPDAFLPELTSSLNNRASIRWDLGRHEAAMADLEEAIRVLSPQFLRHPEGLARQISGMVRSYRACCTALDRPPDPTLLQPILAVLGEG